MAAPAAWMSQGEIHHTVTTVYSVENVTKAYGKGVLANDGIELAVSQGEVFGLLGPNGAGKTTLVRQMVALLRPDVGRILYRGRSVGPHDLGLKRNVAYLSQRPFALLDLTVREAIAFTGQLRGLHSRDSTDQADELIDLFRLTDCADRLVGSLSGGQQRVVSLSSALVGNPETLVLDEPTNDLDPEMRRRVWSTLRGRSHSVGTTVFLVTHHALEAEQVIERLAILMAGKVIAYGTPGDIKAGLDDRIRLELTFRDQPDPDFHHGFFQALSRLGQVSSLSRNRIVLATGRVQARETIRTALDLIPLTALDDFRILTATLEDVYLQTAARATADTQPEGSP